MKKLNFKSIGMRAASVAAGGGASAVANKFTATLSPKIRGMVKIAAGILLPELAPKNKFLGEAGLALAGAGAAELANTFMGNTGVQGVGDPEYMVNGDGDYVVAGDDVNGANDALGSPNDALGNDDETF